MHVAYIPRLYVFMRVIELNVQKTIETNPDLVAVYSDYLKTVNPVNVGHFISSYIKYVSLTYLLTYLLTYCD